MSPFIHIYSIQWKWWSSAVVWKLHLEYDKQLISTGMQPRAIHMVIQPPDLLLDLFRARQGQLAKLYPQFREEFLQSERKLKEHGEMLKGRREENSEELNRHVIQQLQLREYRLAKPNPKFSIKPNRIKPHPKRPEDNNNRTSNEDQSRRSSELSETGFRPYHISNFKKSLQNYKLHLTDNLPRESIAK